jgi:hypothetical protein
MARLFIKGVSQRDKIQNITSLSSAERESLVRAVEANTPQFLTASTANPPSGFGDVGIYYNVEKNRVYALKGELLVNSGDPDTIQVSIGTDSELTQIGMTAGGGSDAVGGGILVENASTAGRVGAAFAPAGGVNPPKWVLFTTVFRADEAATLSVQVESGTTILLEAGTNFTLYEINQND